MQILMSVSFENQTLRFMKNNILVAVIANAMTYWVIMSANANLATGEMGKARKDAGLYFQDMQQL